MTNPRHHDTVVAALRSATCEHRGLTFVLPRVPDAVADPSREPDGVAESADRFVSHRELGARAFDLGAKLSGLGLRKGDRLGLVIADQLDFARAFFGALCAGVVPVPMYPPGTLKGAAAYAQQLEQVLDHASVRAVVTDVHLACAPGTPRLSLDAIDRAAAGPVAAVAADDIAFLQYTSGSTGRPKGVVVTHGALVDNACSIVEALGLDPERDRGVSWLPMYHDMGLVGFLVMPVLHEGSTWYLPTAAFARRPTSWIELIHRVRATASCAPNFAYALLADRVADEQLQRWDLSSWRIAATGAEPVRARTMERFAARFAAAGFQRSALLACYGMAEATVAISFGAPARGIVTRAASVEPAAGDEPRAPASPAPEPVVSCGRVIPGHELRIVDERGGTCADGRIGEITVRGPSVATRYHDDTVASQRTFRDGWLHTGDRGFVADGELYVTGRIKDLLVINGQNVDPHAVEWSVRELSAARYRPVVAFSRPGPRSEELVVMIEGRAGSQLAEFRRDVARCIRSACGLVLSDLVMVPAGAIPKTTSGKVRRQSARRLYLERYAPRAKAETGT